MAKRSYKKRKQPAKKNKKDSIKNRFNSNRVNFIKHFTCCFNLW